MMTLYWVGVVVCLVLWLWGAGFLIVDTLDSGDKVGARITLVVLFFGWMIALIWPMLLVAIPLFVVGALVIIAYGGTE